MEEEEVVLCGCGCVVVGGDGVVVRQFFSSLAPHFFLHLINLTPPFAI